MTISVTTWQSELLRFIEAYQAENQGISPSFKEMTAGIGAKSRSRVFDLLEGLEDRGLIRRLRGRARAIEIISNRAVSIAPDGAPLFAVPSYMKYRWVGERFARWPTYAGARP